MTYEKLLNTAKKALETLDAETLVNCYAPEFTLVDVPSSSVMKNKNDLRAYYDRLFALPDCAFDKVDFFQMGERAAGEWTWRGKSPSGKEFSIRGASLFMLAEDGIREEILYYDPRAAID